MIVGGCDQLAGGNARAAHRIVMGVGFEREGELPAVGSNSDLGHVGVEFDFTDAERDEFSGGLRIVLKMNVVRVKHDALDERCVRELIDLGAVADVGQSFQAWRVVELDDVRELGKAGNVANRLVFKAQHHVVLFGVFEQAIECWLEIIEHKILVRQIAEDAQVLCFEQIREMDAGHGQIVVAATFAAEAELVTLVGRLFAGRLPLEQRRCDASNCEAGCPDARVGILGLGVRQGQRGRAIDHADFDLIEAVLNRECNAAIEAWSRLIGNDAELRAGCDVFVCHGRRIADVGGGVSLAGVYR